jgi:hypothetical protein
LLFKLQNDALAVSRNRQQSKGKREKASNGHMPIKTGDVNGHMPINAEPPFDRLYELMLGVFSRHTKITWNTYIRNRLPLLDMPSDLRQALTEGHIDQSKARELARIPDGKMRKALLDEVIRSALTSEGVKARVRDYLNLPATDTEFSADLRVITRRLKALTNLPDDKRARVRELMAELRELLEPKTKTRSRRTHRSEARGG